MKRTAAIVGLLLVPLLGACDSDPAEPAPEPTPGPPVSLEVLPFIIRTLVGDSILLTADVRDSAGVPVDAAVEWTAVNQDTVGGVSVARQGRDGVLRAEGPGWARVRATLAGHPDLRDSLWIAVSARYRFLSVGITTACAITVANETYCWGTDWEGWRQVFQDFGAAPTQATPVFLLDDARLVEVGAGHICRILLSGETRCWGSDQNGERGEGTVTGGPVVVPEPLDSIASSMFHVCGTTASDRVFCWGLNDVLELGIPQGTTNGSYGPSEFAPVEVPGVRLKTLTAGYDHTCGLDAQGQAYCWGNNSEGQLGRGTIGAPQLPGPVNTAERFRAISARTYGYQTWAITTDGRLFHWGDGTLAPAAFAPSLRFKAVSGLCMVTQEGALYCVRDGALVALAPGVEFERVEEGSNLACALSVAGAVYCWGHEWPEFRFTGTGLNGRGFPIMIAPPGPVPTLEGSTP